MNLRLLRHARIAARRPQRAGFTLTEVAVVLGVVSLGLGGLWTVSGAVLAQRKAQQAAQEIGMIATNLRTMVGTRHSFAQSGFTEITAALIPAKIFPPELLSTQVAVGRGGQLRPVNSWNGSVAVYIIDATNFQVAYYNIPSGDCTRIASQLLDGGASAGGATGMVTNAGRVSIDATAGRPDSLTISNACKSIDNPDFTSTYDGGATGSLEFRYKL